jgi:hypothetical protein
MNFKFDDTIINKNRQLGLVTFQYFSEFQTIIIPETVQRIQNEEQIDEIIKYQMNHKTQYQRFNFLGVINIHYLKSEQKYYLVDGQHRYEAIKCLYKKHGYSDDKIAIEIVLVETLEELKANYKLINKNTPLPEFSDTIDKSIPEGAAIFFKKKYTGIWSKNKRARRPHIWFNYFQESLGFLTKELGDKVRTSEDLILIMEEHNEKMKGYDWSVLKVGETLLKKCNQTGFYFGVYTHVDDWGYKWVKDIIYHQTGREIQGKSSRKKTIPKALKVQAWDKYIGKHRGNVLCICCMHTTIQQSKFHAGHIKSEADGGSTTIDNILPICDSCNYSMKTRHMQNYIEEYHPTNLCFFEERRYFTELELKDHTSKKKWYSFPTFT